MPLVTCPACGREVSAAADACLGCAHPMKQQRGLLQLTRPAGVFVQLISLPVALLGPLLAVALAAEGNVGGSTAAGLASAVAWWLAWEGRQPSIRRP